MSDDDSDTRSDDFPSLDDLANEGHADEKKEVHGAAKTVLVFLHEMVRSRDVPAPRRISALNKLAQFATQLRTAVHERAPLPDLSTSGSLATTNAVTNDDENEIIELTARNMHGDRGKIFGFLRALAQAFQGLTDVQARFRAQSVEDAARGKDLYAIDAEGKLAFEVRIAALTTELAEEKERNRLLDAFRRKFADSLTDAQLKGMVLISDGTVRVATDGFPAIAAPHPVAVANATLTADNATLTAENTSLKVVIADITTNSKQDSVKLRGSNPVVDYAALDPATRTRMGWKKQTH